MWVSATTTAMLDRERFLAAFKPFLEKHRQWDEERDRIQAFCDAFADTWEQRRGDDTFDDMHCELESYIECDDRGIEPEHLEEWMDDMADDGDYELDHQILMKSVREDTEVREGLFNELRDVVRKIKTRYNM